MPAIIGNHLQIKKTDKQAREKTKTGQQGKRLAKRKRLKQNTLFSRFACSILIVSDVDVSVMAFFVYNAKKSFTVIGEKSRDYDKENRFKSKSFIVNKLA